jgi:hypothetical protein
VPQGSILGTLLFLLYINYLPLNVEDVKMVLFADDTNIFVIDKNLDALQLKLRRVMEQLKIWFQKNNLLINMEKTTVMSFHFHVNRPTMRPGIFLKNKVKAYSSKLKFLGITLTENLKWNSHIQALCLNLCQVTFTIKSLRNVVRKWTLRSIYFAKFQSLLKYGIIFWGEESGSTQVLKIQKKVLLVIEGVNR